MTNGTTLEHIPTYLIVSFLAPALLLSIAHACAPPMYDERHYQAMWITLALSQAAGVVDVVFGMILAEQLILQSWMTVAWFVGTIAALHGELSDAAEVGDSSLLYAKQCIPSSTLHPLQPGMQDQLLFPSPLASLFIRSASSAPPSVRP